MVVSEFAAKAGVTPGRVRQLIANKRLLAVKSGGTWLIDEKQLKLRPLLSRPMSKEIAKNLVYLISGMSWGESLRSVEKIRVLNYLTELKSATNPSELLAAWLKDFTSSYKYQINPNDLNNLRTDSLIIPSGVCDQRSNFSQSDFFEGYVESINLKQLEKKYLLVPSENFNVVLRTCSIQLTNPIQLGLLLSDLVEHNSARENAQVKNLVSAI